eukprot:SAG11_NODE_34310_length_272_cov_1.497110_1_plen_61_part_01
MSFYELLCIVILRDAGHWRNIYLLDPRTADGGDKFSTLGEKKLDRAPWLHDVLPPQTVLPK